MTTTNASKASFVLNGTRCKIEFSTQPAQQIGHGRTIDLEPIPEGAIEVSLSGMFDGSSGQCVDEIREAGEDIPEVVELCNLWDRWHLNGMKAGSRKQNEALASYGDIGYDEKRAVLQESGLLVDGEYEYGSAWLFEPIPSEVIGEIAALLDSLNGQRFGDAPSVDDAPDLDADVLDSRDVIKRLEIYREAANAIPEDTDDADEMEILEELKALEELESEASGYSADWNYGAQLIKDDYFEDYARELADDIGAVGSDAAWPNSHIDWSAAADALKQDYTEVTYRGTAYWVR